MPIKARIDMLSTGIRTPIGIKVFGKDLGEMERLAKEIEAVVKTVPGTTSAFAERLTGGSYLNIEPDREQLARYGLSVGELLEVIGTALGGEMVTTTVEGRERFGVTVRYPRELRANPEQIEREVLVPIMGGAMVPLGQVAKVLVARGTPGIRTENALLSAYIFVDIRDRDIGSYVADARKAVADQVKFPPGYYITWSGQFEYMERAVEKMKIVIPVTLLIIFLLLYLNFRRLTETFIVMLSVPFALVGGVWLMWLARLQPVGRRGGRVHCAGRGGCGNGRGDVDLPRPRLGACPATLPQRGAHPRRCRSVRSRHGRRGRARAAEDDDRGGHHGRSAAHHVGHRHRLRSHEPHRGTDGRRDDLVDGADARRDPGAVCPGQTVAAGAHPAQRTRTTGGCSALHGRGRMSSAISFHFVNQGSTMNTQPEIFAALRLGVAAERDVGQRRLGANRDLA